jgi:hypothetical protein
MKFHPLTVVLLTASGTLLSASADPDAASASAAPDPVATGDAWSDPLNPIRVLFNGERLDLWSFQPIRDPAPPPVADPGWARQGLDRFILARLENEGLAPAPEAEPRVLGRRLWLTLTGLPPSPQELEEFLADPATDAYERLVERLLDSPAFGEHWARLWMDLVRYSDSNGYDWDEFRPQMWRYRDYIVRSLNQDKPLDRFIREQLAGDEMVPGEPQDEAEQDALIATGYLRTGPWDNSSKLFNEEHKTRAAHLADLTETTASAFLGLTMSCCRCHDHKTEPLSQEDHYRFRAFFSGVKFADERILDTASTQAAIRQKNQALDEQMDALRAKREALVDVGESLEGQEKEEAVKKRIESLPAGEKAIVEELDQAIVALEQQKQGFTTGVVMTSDPAGEASFLLEQGDPDQPKQAVLPGIPSVFSPQAAAVRDGYRRSALADWITGPEQPLAARVLVNHAWQACFGQGLVTTPSDFGFSGSAPTHPELLDSLATTFRDDGWSLKRLVRKLVTSATWRQTAWPADGAAREKAGRLDPQNTLLWRMNPRRLTAEQLRDGLLAVSGLLKPSPGGPPVWPPLPPEVLQANPAFLDDNAEKTKGWYPSSPEELDVRSLYLVQKRSVRLPFMEAFDQPDNFTSCSRRSDSTVAPQAFALLNNPAIDAPARALAERASKEAPGPAAADSLIQAWRLACGRSPAPEELAILQELLEKSDLIAVCRAILNSSAFLYVD